MRKVKVKRDELEAQGLRVGFKVWGLRFRKSVVQCAFFVALLRLRVQQTE